MNRRPGHLHAVLQRLFMHLQSVISLAAETRNERRMDVEDPLRIMPGEICGQDAQESRQDDQPDFLFFQEPDHFLLIICSQHFPLTDRRPDSCRLRPFQRVGICPAGNHQHDFSAPDDPAFFCIDECLQVGSAAAHQNRNPDLLGVPGLFRCADLRLRRVPSLPCRTDFFCHSASSLPGRRNHHPRPRGS